MGPGGPAGPSLGGLANDVPTVRLDLAGGTSLAPGPAEECHHDPHVIGLPQRRSHDHPPPHARASRHWREGAGHGGSLHAPPRAQRDPRASNRLRRLRSCRAAGRRQLRQLWRAVVGSPPSRLASLGPSAAVRGRESSVSVREADSRRDECDSPEVIGSTIGLTRAGGLSSLRTGWSPE